MVHRLSTKSRIWAQVLIAAHVAAEPLCIEQPIAVKAVETHFKKT